MTAVLFGCTIKNTHYRRVSYSCARIAAQFAAKCPVPSPVALWVRLHQSLRYCRSRPLLSETQAERSSEHGLLMEAILTCRPEDLEDYYGLLGCDELSSTEQILREFKVRALTCHPDKNPESPATAEEFQKLQEAKDVLTDETKRKSYDFWLRTRITVPFKEWQALRDSVRTSVHWAVRTRKEPMLDAAKDESAVGTENQACQSECRGSLKEKPSGEDYWHHKFRWTGEAPSSLLQKFRNYEI